MLIDRSISTKIQELSTKFPIISLTGPRQSGKSTLLKNIFNQYRYISLEDMDMRLMAMDDPRGFLRNIGKYTIIDEAQYAPQLFSYIQTETDRSNECGLYILSGSQNFLLLERISQSLAGRAAILKLFPLTIPELLSATMLPKSLNNLLFNGGYPAIYDRGISPADYYQSYIQTYVDRDIRLLKNISNYSVFARFLKLCAARTGQLLNVTSLSNECGISVPTVNEWLSLLETSYVIYLLKPYYKNFNKRLVKAPKIYFYDTGLLAALLGLTNDEQLGMHYMRGEIFENLVVSECLKNIHHQGREPQLYYWRDSNNNEVDLIIENGTSIQALEIKINASINPRFFDKLLKFQKFSNTPTENLKVVYGGDFDFSNDNGSIISWKNNFI